MGTTPAELDDIRYALDAIAEMVGSQPLHVRTWLRPVAEEVAATRFRVESMRRRAERALAREIWG